ncbi:facilitated trehalose transporter Tret1 [Tribolium castaneum]|uniref:Facilitated trehalose transporter Tret1-2 homolog-like Protein n=1 Tax=Tribolium castaneum TaxID=7070 RepID=D6X029_TRICA|nr:PREDICTED: facilitated trehalose transporter Tret1 [Tribolium castaneum]EFA10058.1 Facilitated trehalose transporter Tret1-2 homolog-like Protein [Tribolium castaneum]|eukprot:XP_967094.1 PREDICTED: facilitated trehalose transporter Tret1 [Tribolium castaneum]
MFKSLSYTLLTVLTVDLLATSGDITMTWTSPVLPKLYSNDSDTNPLGKPIDPDIESWIASLINIGAMVGPFPYGFIAERYGRKVSLLLIAIPHIISYVTFAVSKTAYLYYFGRLLGGIAVGGGYTVLPMYVAEVAEDSNRGMLSATLNIFWTFGNLLPYTLGPYMSIFWFNIILACVPTSFFVLFFLIAPESPYFLIGKNKMNQAEKSLLKLRSNNKKVVENEIRYITSELAKNETQGTFLNFFKTQIYMKGLLISLVLIIAQQLSGINAILFYTEEIFSAAGANGLRPEISSIIIGLVIFVSSFGTPFVVDRLGRKFLLLVSLLGISLSHLAFGTYFYLQTSTDLDISGISWLPITSLVVFIVTFNTGLGPLPWTVSAELFPTSVKPYAASLVSFACWTTSFFVTKFFLDMKKSMGEGETFWLYGGFCFAACLFTYVFVPETKGKSFQEIQEMLER